ncbi:hypothetical protein MELA_02810 [Candidatus Methylomirabilis lanthanidiphila]|uniref:DUF948 domain-containing protein n=1 Tax=Candidatus Methylomirabilis lanthanidiphila TaxID=2211376 RepID=A0A564ZNG9_9BACT|nr:DUF948 domain-containing protein [Candidatus Methylomirabilis lanthanidiphila]VUZ86407.1 hypothetical protein MELA_02810 [Candidatus Methylomirabilis lanthanidiphila]
MPTVEYALWAIVMLFFLLVCSMIPVLVQLRRTARQAEDFLRLVELELRPVLVEVKDVMRNLNRASDQVADGLGKMGGTLDAIAEAGQTVRDVNQLAQQFVFPKLITGAAFTTGLRVGLRTLIVRLMGRR